jgi:hypothetical protein
LIDIEHCELASWPVYECDCYGARARRYGDQPDLPGEMLQVGKKSFSYWARSADSRGWINAKDLPVEKLREITVLMTSKNP